MAEVAVPTGKNLDYGSSEFTEFEGIGVGEIPRVAFVLVAGGLGERLGYSGIKLALPVDLVSMLSYIGYYCECIKALQRRATERCAIPLTIMTSDDTHARTVEALDSHGYFGLDRAQITLVKQEKVAALMSNDARIACNGYEIVTKPHGHGDVHMLLHKQGLVKKWQGEGKKWVVFFQDTNGLVFRTMLAVLGVSKSLKLDLNSMCIPRLPKQEIGAITRLIFEDGHEITANTEYNQLGSLLKAMGNANGDTADETGFSPFPGNINQLVVGIDCYGQLLDKTHGVMEEFVNPKYKDHEKREFKKPTRLECMMQDVAKVRLLFVRLCLDVRAWYWFEVFPGTSFGAGR